MANKYLKSTDRGAPVLTGVRGAGLTVLDAALVSGFPIESAASASVTSEVLTVTEAGSKRRAGQKVTVSSATTPALNGEYTVDTADGTGFVCVAVTGLGDTSVADAIVAGETFVGTPTSISLSGSTVTVNLTGHGFAVGERARISGAAQGDYNGYWEVATVADADNFTYTLPAGLAPASPATGTFLVSYGSTGLGWTKKYTTTNKTVYEQGASGGSAQKAVLVANEADTGTNPYAIALMMAEGATDASTYSNQCYAAEGAAYSGIYKSKTADATARPWKVVGDHRTAIFLTKPGCAGSSMNPTGWQYAYAGDIDFDVPSAVWPQALFLPGRHSSYATSSYADAAIIYNNRAATGTNYYVRGSCSVNNVSATYNDTTAPGRMLRGYGQAVGPVTAALHAAGAQFTNSVANMSYQYPMGNDTSATPYDEYPSPVTGGLLYNRLSVGAAKGNPTGAEYRKVGDLRGAYAPLHRPPAGWVDGDQFSVGGKTMEVVFHNGGTSSWMLLDISDNWS